VERDASGGFAAAASPVDRTEEPAPAAPPGEDTIQELLPQARRRQHPTVVVKTKPSHTVAPGDLICAVCGEGNAPTRRFCARCGESLVNAVPVKVPWWRRLLQRLIPRRGPKVVKLKPGTGTTGTADGSAKGVAVDDSHFDGRSLLRRVYRRGRIIIAFCLVAGGAVYGVYPPFRDTVNRHVTSIKQKITNEAGQALVPIHAVQVTANASLPRHGASLATDELLNTYWLAPWSPSSVPSLTLTFSHPVTLEKVILHSGASDAYIADGRPSTLHLVFSNHESFTIQPQDTAQAQTYGISHAVLVKSVEIQIPSVYQGSGPSPNVAITEIELFGIQ
jgi:hypothetical protein